MGSFYDTESDIWAGLSNLGSLEFKTFLYVLFISILSNILYRSSTCCLIGFLWLLNQVHIDLNKNSVQTGCVQMCLVCPAL